MSKINTTNASLIKEIKAEKKSGNSTTIQIYFRICDGELFAIAEDTACMRDCGAVAIYSAPTRTAAADIAAEAFRRAEEIVAEVESLNK